MDYNDKCLTINGIEYIVIEQVNDNNHVYLYLVNDDKPSDTMFVEIKDNDVLTIESKLFQERIYPKFLDKFRKKEAN